MYGLITEHNVPPHVQVPVYMMPTPLQTGLTVKGIYGTLVQLGFTEHQLEDAPRHKPQISQMWRAL